MWHVVNSHTDVHTSMTIERTDLKPQMKLIVLWKKPVRHMGVLHGQETMNELFELHTPPLWVCPKFVEFVSEWECDDYFTRTGAVLMQQAHLVTYNLVTYINKELQRKIYVFVYLQKEEAIFLNIFLNLFL